MTNENDLNIEDRLEAAYIACKVPIEEVIAGIKQAIREYLETQGFIVELVKREGTRKERTMEYFFVDRMISFEQIRNGYIRNESDATRYVELKKSQVRIDMNLSEKYQLSLETIQRIRWRER